MEVPIGNFVRVNWRDGTQGVYLHTLSIDSDVIDVGSVEFDEYSGESNDTGQSQGSHLHYMVGNNQDDERPDGASSNPANFNDP